MVKEVVDEAATGDRQHDDDLLASGGRGDSDHEAACHEHSALTRDRRFGDAQNCRQRRHRLRAPCREQHERAQLKERHLVTDCGQGPQRFHDDATAGLHVEPASVGIGPFEHAARAFQGERTVARLQLLLSTFYCISTTFAMLHA